MTKDTKELTIKLIEANELSNQYRKKTGLKLLPKINEYDAKYILLRQEQSSKQLYPDDSRNRQKNNSYYYANKMYAIKGLEILKNRLDNQREERILNEQAEGMNDFMARLQKKNSKKATLQPLTYTR